MRLGRPIKISAAILLSMSLAGCKRAPKPLECTVSLVGTAASSGRIFVGENEIPSEVEELRAGEADPIRSLRFMLPAPGRVVRGGDDLNVSLQIVTPCGPRKVKLVVTGFEGQAVERGNSVGFRLTESFLSSYLAVDNRDGLGKRLKFGQSEISLKPGAQTFEVLLPTCPEGREIELDGRRIGAVDETFGRQTETHCELGYTRIGALIDGRGGHCYAYRHVTTATVKAGGSSSGTESRFAGKRVYMLPVPGTRFSLFTPELPRPATMRGGPLAVVCHSEIQDDACKQ